MSHVRQQIREAAVAELSVVPEFANAVYSTRLYNFRNTNLPACNVYADSEESEPQTMQTHGPRVTRRSLTLVTECYVEVADNPDNAVDDLAVLVEQVIGASTFGGLAFDVSLGTTAFDFDATGEKTVAIVTLAWQVLYQTTESDPETAL